MLADLIRRGRSGIKLNIIPYRILVIIIMITWTDAWRSGENIMHFPRKLS